jgi:hypothetical protein
MTSICRYRERLWLVEWSMVVRRSGHAAISAGDMGISNRYLLPRRSGPRVVASFGAGADLPGSDPSHLPYGIRGHSRHRAKACERLDDVGQASFGDSESAAG